MVSTRKFILLPILSINSRAILSRIHYAIFQYALLKMNQIPTYLIIIFVQLFILAMVAATFFYVQWRQSIKKQMQKTDTKADTTQDNDDVIRPDASTYLFMEAKLTEGRHETLGFQDADKLSESDQTEQVLLKLRSDFLLVENELSKNVDERDEDFWLNTVKQLKELLRTNNLYGAVKAQFSDEDDIGLSDMMDDQAANIDQLREYITAVVKEEDTAMHIGLVLDIIEGRQRELADCLGILEDQNGFLREQIQQLSQPNEEENELSTETEVTDSDASETNPAPESASAT